RAAGGFVPTAGRPIERLYRGLTQTTAWSNTRIGPKDSRSLDGCSCRLVQCELGRNSNVNARAMHQPGGSPESGATSLRLHTRLHARAYAGDALAPPERRVILIGLVAGIRPERPPRAGCLPADRLLSVGPRRGCRNLDRPVLARLHRDAPAGTVFDDR